MTAHAKTAGRHTIPLCTAIGFPRGKGSTADARSRLCPLMTYFSFKGFISIFHTRRSSAPFISTLMLRFWTATLSVATVVCAPAVASVSIYPTLQSPSEHPLYHKRCVQPPEYSAFGANGRSLSCLTITWH